MEMLKYLLPILLLTPTLTYSEENFCGFMKPHRIDVWYEDALSNNPDIKTRENIIKNALAKWDNELNREYNELYSTLKDEDKIKLRKAQRAWIRFRDAEFEFNRTDAVFGKNECACNPIRSNAQIAFIKNRLCDLMHYKTNAYDNNH